MPTKGQVLLIKACWGGKSLGHNFLPPSVGKYPPPVEPDDPGYFYHRILQIVNEVTENIETYFPDYKGQGMEIAGLCCHQGWNDQYGGLDAKYEEQPGRLHQGHPQRRTRTRRAGSSRRHRDQRHD